MDVLSPDLNIGQTLAILFWDGKMPSVKDVLTIWEKGTATVWIHFFSKADEIPV